MLFFGLYRHQLCLGAGYFHHPWHHLQLFFTTGRIVFNNKDNWLIIRFILVYAVTMSLDVFVLKRLVENMTINKYLAGALTTIPIALLSFLLNSVFTFKTIKLCKKNRQRIHDDHKRRTNAKKISSITAVFPAYNDAGTIPSMVLTALIALRQVTDDYEVVVTNDGSKDATGGAVLQELASRFPELKVITHETNLGYGCALRSGFAAATKDWIFFILTAMRNMTHSKCLS